LAEAAKHDVNKIHIKELQYHSLFVEESTEPSVFSRMKQKSLKKGKAP